MNRNIAIRNKHGAIESVEERAYVEVMNIPKMVENCVELLTSERPEYGLGDIVRLAPARLFGWDDLTQSAVLQVKVSARASVPAGGSRGLCFLLSFLAGQRLALPVPNDVIRKAAAKAAHDVSAPVARAMMWIWNISARQLQTAERRHELLFLPVRQPPRRALRLDENHAILGDSHDVSAVSIARDSDCYYALRPVIADLLERYPRFEGKSQWYALRSPRPLGKISSAALRQSS